MSIIRLDVERPVRGPDVAGGHEDHVHQGPDPEAAEAEELADALLPVAEVEPVRAEPAEGDGEEEGGGPAVALRPVALPLLAEHVPAQAQRVLGHGAVRNVPVSLAARGADTAATWTTLYYNFFKLNR